MIVEWLMSIAAGVAEWFVNLFPDWEPPEELVNVDDSFQTIFDLGEGLGPWADWGYIGLIASIPLGLWVLGLTVKGWRALAAHLPFVGGRG